MKLCRFQPLEFDLDAVGRPAHPEPLSGVIEGATVREIIGELFSAWRPGERSWPLERVRLLPPVSPSKIVCVGKNYKEHAAEFDGEVPKEPVIFLKPPSAIIGPGEPIVLTPLSKRVDYEGELALVVGRLCRHLGERDDPRPFLLGYMCLNDVTARDLQRADGQWTRGKSFDTFCPMGPLVETQLDLGRTTVETFVNGERKQFARATDMAYSPDFIVRWLSRVMTLLPGDVIATGTPAGVGPLKAGDVVEVAVNGVGTLRNPVVADSA